MIKTLLFLPMEGEIILDVDNDFFLPYNKLKSISQSIVQTDCSIVLWKTRYTVHPVMLVI